MFKETREWRGENPKITAKKRRNSHVNLLQGLIITRLYGDSNDVNTVI